MTESEAEKIEKSQLDKFKKAARALECDDDDHRFKERLEAIAKAKAKPKSDD